MALTFTPSTELEAVNVLLGTIGEAPTSSLAVTGLVDTAVAQSVLHEVSRLVQVKGWNFNTEIDYPITPEVGTGYLLTPAAALKVRLANGFRHRSIVWRGTKMYDRATRSYDFSDENTTLKFDIVLFLEFAELNEPMRRYITIRAARIFQSRTLGSDTIHQFTQEEEYDARGEMVQADAEEGDANVLTGTLDSYNISFR